MALARRTDGKIFTSESANPQKSPKDAGECLFEYNGFGPEAGGVSSFVAHLTAAGSCVVVKFRTYDDWNGGTRGLACLIDYMDGQGLDFQTHSEGTGGPESPLRPLSDRYCWITAVFRWRDV